MFYLLVFFWHIHFAASIQCRSPIIVRLQILFRSDLKWKMVWHLQGCQSGAKLAPSGVLWHSTAQRCQGGPFSSATSMLHGRSMMSAKEKEAFVILPHYSWPSPIPPSPPLPPKGSDRREGNLIGDGVFGKKRKSFSFFPLFDHAAPPPSLHFYLLLFFLSAIVLSFLW